MSITRRQFLGRNAAGLSLVSFSSMGPSAVLRRAAAAASESEHRDRGLVVVELNGGNDGRNTTEKVRFCPGVACQARPCRPRPAL